MTTEGTETTLLVVILVKIADMNGVTCVAQMAIKIPKVCTSQAALNVGHHPQTRHGKLVIFK